MLRGDRTAKTFVNRNLSDTAARRRRGGFSLIELLMVVGVIVVLAGIVLLGMRSLTGSNKERETRLTLQNLRNMLAEFESQTRFGKSPPSWGWYNGGTHIVVTPSPGVDFWRVAYPNPSDAAFMRPLDAPGDLRSTTGQTQDPTNVTRNAARQLINTQLAMNLILSIPANRRAFEQLDASTRFTPNWIGGQSLRAPGGDRVLYTIDDGPSTLEDIRYYPGNRVIHNGRVYRCQREHSSTSSPSAPSGSPFWAEEGSAEETVRSAPSGVLLDAWGNPILFVPASGLYVRRLGDKTTYEPADVSQTYVIVSPEGSADAPRIGAAGVLQRSGKPFFVSAGPDGDFATANDNLYSFED